VKVTTKLLRTDDIKKINLKTGSTVFNLLEKMNLKPDTLIVMKDNTPIPVDDKLNEGDELTIILVSSGG
jgi:sulfur carrier protein ThiS